MTTACLFVSQKMVIGDLISLKTMFIFMMAQVVALIIGALGHPFLGLQQPNQTKEIGCIGKIITRELRKENEELKTAMVRLENEIRNKNYAQLDAKLTKEANENLSKSTFDLRKERDELKKALDFHNVLDKTRQEMIRCLEKEKEELKESLRKSSAGQTYWKMESEGLQKQASRKNSLYEESQRLRSEGINFEDLVEVKQAYDDLHKQAGCMNISLNKKTIEIEELKQKLATNNGRLRSCREGNEELKEKNKQLESFRDHFVRQTITPAPIYEDAKSQIKEFHLENHALQEELKELQGTYDSSEVELSNTQLELKNFKEMFEVSEEKKIWDKVMTDFEERHKAVEHKLKYWCNEAAKFQKERDELKKNLDVETEEHTNLKKAMDLIRKNHLTVPSYQYIPNPYPLIRY